MPESIVSFLNSKEVTNLKSETWSLVTKDVEDDENPYCIAVEGTEAKYPCAWLYAVPNDKQTLVLVSRQRVYVLALTKVVTYQPLPDSEWYAAPLSELGVQEVSE